MKEIIVKGWIKEGNDDEGSHIFVNSDEPLTKVLEDVVGHQVKVRYYISEKELDYAEMVKGFVKHLYGDIDAEYDARYSDVTGFLWCDEKLVIGGHDLLKELESNIGKFLYLEIHVI